MYIKKISETILEFGEEVFCVFPDDATKIELENSAKLVILVWNAFVMDQWNNNNDAKKSMFDLLRESQIEEGAIALINRLIDRKRTMFSKDLRAVGHWEFVKRNGEWVLRAEARANVANMEAEDIVH